MKIRWINFISGFLVFVMLCLYAFPLEVNAAPASSPKPNPVSSPATPASPPQPFDLGLPVPTAGQEIVQIEIRGNRQVPSEKVMDQVTSKIGDLVDETQLRRDVQAIFDMGFFSDVKVDRVKVEKGVKVVFLVVENPTVRSINIQGAALVPVSKLTDLMKTTTGQILNTRALYQDVLTINQYYESLGYTDPTNHVVDMSWSPDGTVTLKIQEGLVIRAIQIQGNTVYPTAKLRPLIHAQVGQVFNRKQIESDLGNIADLYKNDDYVLTGLKGNINPDGTVIIDITETRIEAMRIEGNVKTKNYVIYRVIKTKVGDVLRSRRIQKDVERLNNTGFFETVNVEPQEGTAPGKVIVVWKIKEQRTGTASLGIGYSGGNGANRGGLAGAVSLSEKNIMGTGQAAFVQWQRSTLVESISFGYTNPWIDRHEDSISISFFNSNFFNQALVIPGTNPPQFSFYDDHRSGGSVTLGRPVFDEDTHAYVSLAHETIATSGIAPSAAGLPIFNNVVQGNVNSGSTSLVRDTRDDVFDTSHGSFYSASYERAGPPFGGTFEFNKYQGDVRQYFPFVLHTTLAFRVLAGVGKGNLPITDWYILGGSDTLRGYTVNRFIGTRMFLGSTEVRFPLGKQNVFKGAAFVDVGQAWQPGEQVNLGNMTMDYGFGIRMKLPNLGLGIVRLDFAFGKEGNRSVIGIGQAF